MHPDVSNLWTIFNTVWNLTQRFKTTKLSLHTSSVDNLLFSPSMEPILVSQGEYVAWWNLKRFQETPQKGGKPKSIGILDSICKDVSSMDLSFWGDRQYIKNIEYLLACINLHGRPRCLSASKDFNSFLTVDEKGKIYVMDIVTNSSD
ncbi:hypothetical protein NQ318_018320 [Aromia moschata]|uniref:Uncharacterized protein n=1 Tax=Aromia moschata TaxID=1265417 RepID=A0AAV8ZG21_9CUCU|nr:hypothetical protein NQ318_018320 [Aromia moschata]